MCCRVSVRNEASCLDGGKRRYSLALLSRNGKAICETHHSLSGLSVPSLDCCIRGVLGRSSRRFIVASHVVRYLGVSALLCSLVPAFASAQASATPGPHPRWEIPGFDFRKDGVWRTKARAVRAARHAMLSRGGP